MIKHLINMKHFYLFLNNKIRKLKKILIMESLKKIKYSLTNSYVIKSNKCNKDKKKQYHL